MCQKYMNHEGRSQQSLVIDTPKFHKRYILPSAPVRKPIDQSLSPRKHQRSETFSFSSITTAPKKEQDKRTVSLLRAGSVAVRQSSISRPTTPSKIRAITPKRYPSEPRRPVAFEKESWKETEQQQQQQPSKSKRLLKALLSRRKTKKHDTLYTFLDEY